MKCLACLTSLIFLLFSGSSACAQRPIYVIAHRVNDVDTIDKALSLGANAVECDIRFWRPGGKIEFVVDHDAVVPGHSTKLSDWLVAAKKAAEKHKHFALIYFDMKVNEIDANAPLELLRQARAVLPADFPLIFSTASFEKRAFFDRIKDNLGPKDGLAIDEDKDPDRVQRYFRDELKTKNHWYGYGTFAGGIDRVESYIRKGIEVRDKEGGIKKVCVWTLERDSSIERYIKDFQVDALIVNVAHSLPLHSSPVPSAVKFANKYGRLATRNDDPFVVYKK